MQQIEQISEIEPKNPSEVMKSEHVAQLATVWGRYSEALAELQKVTLIDFCERYEFTKDEYDAYKRGVASVLEFFLNCHEEITQKEFKEFKAKAVEGKK